MLHRWLEIASTPSVKAERERNGSAAQYARVDGTLDRTGPVRNDRFGDAESEFIAGRDGFYLASVSETGWPYVQYRGGPIGFLRVLDDRTLGFADFRGNRQYVTAGNIATNDRVSLFLMDYAHRRRLKIFGHLRMIDRTADPELVASLASSEYSARWERAALIRVEAFDWNCPQHITPRFTQEELEPMLAPIREEIETLRAENQRLHHLLGRKA
ncbi:pyridoxamine 5'-phosphate oxidase family protein [Microvirga pudoricolor]|uniref:pyridoxamine 5'-phosphate oxidase family protein n=1 Tax=Microvirga pudoricolor TaxID=2778729 RepID=UPI00194E62E0|nr:pyridoxamine 5'-phosphate oxidase family protein [Microvirga pudoricolor]MBM6593578.1 pyridoxamine 5'-phosphate oxidase family protein [Microvirga pudoricolor]